MLQMQPAALSLSPGPSILNSRLLSENPEPPQRLVLNLLEVSPNQPIAECTEQPACPSTRDHEMNSQATYSQIYPNHQLHTLVIFVHSLNYIFVGFLIHKSLLSASWPNLPPLSPLHHCALAKPCSFPSSAS